MSASSRLQKQDQSVFGPVFPDYGFYCSWISEYPGRKSFMPTFPSDLKGHSSDFPDTSIRRRRTPWASVPFNLQTRVSPESHLPVYPSGRHNAATEIVREVFEGFLVGYTSIGVQISGYRSASRLAVRMLIRKNLLQQCIIRRTIMAAVMADFQKMTGLSAPSLFISFQLRISASPGNSNFQPRHFMQNTILLLLAALLMASRLSRRESGVLRSSTRL